METMEQEEGGEDGRFGGRERTLVFVGEVIQQIRSSFL